MLHWRSIWTNLPGENSENDKTMLRQSCPSNRRLVERALTLCLYCRHESRSNSDETSTYLWLRDIGQFICWTTCGDYKVFVSHEPLFQRGISSATAHVADWTAHASVSHHIGHSDAATMLRSASSCCSCDAVTCCISRQLNRTSAEKTSQIKNFVEIGLIVS